MGILNLVVKERFTEKGILSIALKVLCSFWVRVFQTEGTVSTEVLRWEPCTLARRSE